MRVVLEARGLAVTLPSHTGQMAVLGGVDLQVSAGEIVEIVGPSGAGKTTLLRALARLLPEMSGQLFVDGESAEETSPELWRSRVALVPQIPKMWPGTVGENLTLPWRLKVRAGALPPSDAAMRAGLAEVGLADVELARDSSRLSVGQQARVSLLRTALASPRVLLLDEPDANLDDAAAEAVSAYVSRFAMGGGCVVRVRHLPRGDEPDRRLRLQAGSLTEVTDA